MSEQVLKFIDGVLHLLQQAEILGTETSSLSKAMYDPFGKKAIDKFLSGERAYIRRMEVLRDLLATTEAHTDCSNLVAMLQYHHQNWLNSSYVSPADPNGHLRPFAIFLATVAASTHPLERFATRQNEYVLHYLQSYHSVKAAALSPKHVEITTKRTYLTSLIAEPLNRLSSYIAISEVSQTFPTFKSPNSSIAGMPRDGFRA
jgi:hypothetical protein